MSSPDPHRKPLKTQPKNVTRRSLEERETLARSEAEARETRARAAAAEKAAETAEIHQKYGFHAESRRHGRWSGKGMFGRRRRARGGFMEQRERARSPALQQPATELNGVSRGAKRGGKGGGAAAARGDRVSAGAGEKRGGRRRGRTGARADPKVKKEDGDVAKAGALNGQKQDQSVVELSDDDEGIDYGPPVNVELLDISDESDDETRDGRWHRMLPVHVRRAEHVDRKIGINTQASADTAAGIKREPGEHDEEVQNVKESPRKHKGKEKVGTVELDDEAKGLAPEKGRGRRKVIDLLEELDERERRFRRQELDIIRNELGPKVSSAAETSAGYDADEKDDSAQDHKENKVYLFQFPPIIPPLTAATRHVKQEPQPEPPPRPPPQPGPAVKVEDEEVVVKEEEEEEAQRRTYETAAQEQKLFPPGRVGKLRVHKSGRTTLDWGGILMDVGVGMENSFYQTAMMVEAGRQDAKDGSKGKNGPIKGEAISLGPVSGKFVVKPNMNELLKKNDSNQNVGDKSDGSDDEEDNIEEVDGVRDARL